MRTQGQLINANDAHQDPAHGYHRCAMLFQCLVEARAQIAAAAPARAASRAATVMSTAGSVVLVQAKRFSGQALDPVAGDRVAAGRRRDRQPQARMSFVIGEHRQAKISIGKTPASLPDFAKFGRLVQSLARLELQFTDRIEQPASNAQGQRRLRPFARRRASNCRPLLVAMRARKPWVRARCKLLGLKVRFIAQLQEKHGNPSN